MNLKKRHKSARKKWTIALLIVAFLIVLSFSLAFYRAPQGPPKKTAEEYFDFSNLSGIARSVSNSTVRFTHLYFDIIAKAGDAYHFVIIPPGMTDPADYYHLDDIKNGTTTPIEIVFAAEVQSTRIAGGKFPIELKIYCDEAEGDVTLHVPESELITV